MNVVDLIFALALFAEVLFLGICSSDCECRGRQVPIGILGLFLLFLGNTVAVVARSYHFYRLAETCIVVASLLVVALLFIALRMFRGRYASLLAFFQVINPFVLREEREFFRTILDNTSSIIFAKSREGRYLFVNGEYARRYGKGSKSVLGKNDYEIFPPEFAEAFQKNDRLVFESGQVSELEEYAPSENGVETFLSVKFPIRDRFGNIYAVGGIATNISSLKRAQDESRQVNAFLDSIIEHVPDMLFVKEAKELRFVRFNRAGEQLLGISTEDILGKNDYDFFPSEQADFFIKKDREVLECGYVNIDEEPIDTKAKGRRYLHTQKIALYDDHGNPEFLLGISQDITAQKLATQNLERAHLELERRVTERTEELRNANQQLEGKFLELVEAEEKFRLAIESAPSAMIMVDSDGRMVLVNAETERMFGYRREELLGNQVEILVPRDVAQQMVPRKTKATGRKKQVGRTTIEGEFVARRKDASTFPIEVSFNSITTSQGNYALSALIDLTQRKSAEEFMRRSLREKDLLVKEIHHRVKNNMQVISSLLRLQSGYVEDETVRRLLKQSDDRVRSMALIHERLYRSDGFSQIDFFAYIEELSQNLFHSYVIDKDRITLHLELEKVFLGIDQAIPCGLILNEVVSNSLKHAFPGGRSGDLFIRLKCANSGDVYLEVEDTGIGLPKTESQKVTPFGLEIVRTLCAQIQGSLKIEGENGTRIQIQFKKSEPVTSEDRASGDRNRLPAARH